MLSGSVGAMLIRNILDLFGFKTGFFPPKKSRFYKMDLDSPNGVGSP